MVEAIRVNQRIMTFPSSRVSLVQTQATLVIGTHPLTMVVKQIALVIMICQIGIYQSGVRKVVRKADTTLIACQVNRSR
jgi:hypothetical protein